MSLPYSLVGLYGVLEGAVSCQISLLDAEGVPSPLQELQSVSGFGQAEPRLAEQSWGRGWAVPTEEGPAATSPRDVSDI